MPRRKGFKKNKQDKIQRFRRLIKSKQDQGLINTANGSWRPYRQGTSEKESMQR